MSLHGAKIMYSSSKDNLFLMSPILISKFYVSGKINRTGQCFMLQLVCWHLIVDKVLHFSTSSITCHHCSLNHSFASSTSFHQAGMQGTDRWMKRLNPTPIKPCHTYSIIMLRCNTCTWLMADVCVGVWQHDVMLTHTTVSSAVEKCYSLHHAQYCMFIVHLIYPESLTVPQVLWIEIHYEDIAARQHLLYTDCKSQNHILTITSNVI